MSTLLTIQQNKKRDDFLLFLSCLFPRLFLSPFYRLLRCARCWAKSLSLGGWWLEGENGQKKKKKCGRVIYDSRLTSDTARFSKSRCFIARNSVFVCCCVAVPACARWPCWPSSTYSSRAVIPSSDNSPILFFSLALFLFLFFFFGFVLFRFVLFYGLLSRHLLVRLLAGRRDAFSLSRHRPFVFVIPPGSYKLDGPDANSPTQKVDSPKIE